MAGSFTPIYRNLNDSDTVMNTNYTPGTSTFPTIDALGWSKDGYQFKEYNLSRDGTGTSYHPGENISTSQNIYVIWEEIPKPDMKTLTIGEATYKVVDSSAVHTAGGVAEGDFWADASASSPEFQIQSKHTNGQELALKIQDNGWITLYKLTTADDWSTATTLFDLSLTTRTPTASVTATTGTLVSASAKQFGNVVQLNLRVKNSAATSNNAIIFAGKLNTTALRPAALIQNSFSYGGTIHMNGWMTTAGDISLRHMGTSSLAANTTVDMSFVYLVS